MLSDYFHKKAAIKRIPLDGAFELSPVCNFHCKMCYVRKTPEQIKAEKKKLIPWQQWLELAKECRNAGMLYLLLTGGEPFLYPGFKELYVELQRMGFILSINSNGTMIDEEMVEWLKQYAPSKINITLYGSSPETYEKICGNAAGYAKAIRAIHLLHDAGIPVVINASMIPENVDDLEDIIDFGKGLGLNTRVSTYMFPPIRRKQEKEDSRFSPEEAANVFLRKQKKVLTSKEFRIFAEKTLEKKERMEIQSTWGTKDEYMRCRAGKSSFWISWEGKMTACGLLDFPLTTEPFKTPFLECWMQLTNAVRNSSVLHGCANCGNRNICKPCVAMIYSETGSIKEKAPYLCKMSECINAYLVQELEAIKDAEE